jgi:diguanylate cyclase (GGDEF)-like protein
MYKEILPVIDLDIIVAVILIIILFMYKRKFNMNDKKNKVYVSIIITTTIVILLEILDKLILLNHSNSVIPITKIINTLGFAMSPIVPYLWIKYLSEDFGIKLNLNILKIPIIINLIASIMTYKYGYIFSVTNFNIYKRGTLFFMPMVITYIFFIISLIIIYKNKDKISKTEYIILMLFELIPMVMAFIEVFFDNLLLIWGSVGIAIITNYIYLQENLLKYDALTGAWNRMSFESYFYNKFMNKNKEFCLVYVDINDFKIINDTYGHNEGDIALINISKALRKSFEGVGKVARIGGDEFIIVADICCETKLEDRINNIYLELEKLNEKRDKSYKLKISVGCKKFNDDYLDLSEYIKEVDKLMYLDKIKKKSNNCEKI